MHYFLLRHLWIPLFEMPCLFTCRVLAPQATKPLVRICAWFDSVNVDAVCYIRVPRFVSNRLAVASFPKQVSVGGEQCRLFCRIPTGPYGRPAGWVQRKRCCGGIAVEMQFFSEGQTGAKSGWLALWTGLAVLVGFVGNSVRSKISDGNLAAKHVALRLSLDWCTALELRRGPFELYEFDIWYIWNKADDMVRFRSWSLRRFSQMTTSIMLASKFTGASKWHSFCSFTWRPPLAKGDVLRLDVALQFGMGVPLLHEHQQLWWTGLEHFQGWELGISDWKVWRSRDVTIFRQQISMPAFYWPFALQLWS